MTQHSPEPWVAHAELHNGHPTCGFAVRNKSYGIAHFFSAPTVCPNDPLEAEANAKRAVACVNFCQHMSTEAIERLTKAGIGPETVFGLLDDAECCPACETRYPKHQPDCLAGKALKAWRGA